MEPQDKRKVFELLTDKFETDLFKEYYLDMCEKIPDYIFTMPSSTSGKYHNATQCQTYGQLYHIFMFHSILEHLLRLKGNKEKFQTPQERDCMRCVPAFHDAIKCGLNGSQYTVQDHPLLAARWVLETKVEHDIDCQWKHIIADMCEAHSGEWNKNRSGDVIMSEPRNEREFLIHECDILASRPDIDWIISPELKAVLEEYVKVEVQTADTYVFTFGKHSGKTLAEVYAMHPDYVEWVAENINREPVRTLAKELVGK